MTRSRRDLLNLSCAYSSGCPGQERRLRRGAQRWVISWACCRRSPRRPIFVSRKWKMRALSRRTSLIGRIEPEDGNAVLDRWAVGMRVDDRFATTEAPQPPIRLRQYCPSQASIFIAWGEWARSARPNVFWCSAFPCAARRMDPISRSAKPFCHGDRGAIGLSRMPIARIRCLTTGSKTRSRSRIRYPGADSQGKASVIWPAIHSAVGLFVTPIQTSSRRSSRTMMKP